MHTCRIVLITSLVWFLLDVAVLFYYSDSSPTSQVLDSAVISENHGIVAHGPVAIPGVQAGAQLKKREDSIQETANAANHFAAAHSNLFNKEEVYVLQINQLEPMYCFSNVGPSKN